jgi:DnaJ-class molecular chaperone
MERIFNPEKTGMTLCPECNGRGSFFKGPEQKEVCKKCGGFGYLKKEKPVKKEREEER